MPLRFEELMKQFPPASSGNSDALVLRVTAALVEDLSASLSPSEYTAILGACAEGNVPVLRHAMMLPLDFSGNETPERIKARYQVQAVLKKYTFSLDLFNGDQLSELTWKRFRDNQERLRAHWTGMKLSSNTAKVIFAARGYVDRVLGPFSKYDVLERATFGSKSSVGIPLRLACEGARLEGNITGSQPHIDWFRHLYGPYNRPAYLYAESRARANAVPLFKVCDVLEAVLVNKTFKSKRMIVPNTTLGTLYSGGLGFTIEDRLRKAGYDVKVLQKTHGVLARDGSLSGELATGDQSDASDNITRHLVEALFHHEWADALKFGRIAKLSYKGETLETETFAGMGVGFTFTLQTLVFLSLLKAIKSELAPKAVGGVSAYGDDLIYPTEMHDLVVQIFTELGLKMNVDKTFASGDFRESCGSDYYQGLDVRPLIVTDKGYGKRAGKRVREAFTYKLINAVRHRWGEYGLDETRKVLWQALGEIRGDNSFLAIPPWYPEYSGVRLSRAQLRADDRVSYEVDIHGSISFEYLGFVPSETEEHRHEPYIFKRLRSTSAEFPVPLASLRTSAWYRRGQGHHGYLVADSPPTFQWRWVRVEAGVRRQRGKTRVKAGKRYAPFRSVSNDRGMFRVQRGISGHWDS